MGIVGLRIVLNNRISLGAKESRTFVLEIEQFFKILFFPD